MVGMNVKKVTSCGNSHLLEDMVVNENLGSAEPSLIIVFEK